MNFFDFSDETERAAGEARDEATRLSARTVVGRQRFPGAVQKAGFTLIHPGQPFDPNAYPQILVIGAATWSDPDLATLDRLANDPATRRFKIFVFDIDDWGLDAILHTFPGSFSFLSTPMVAQYRGGSLVFFGAGPEVFHWLEQL